MRVPGGRIRGGAALVLCMARKPRPVAPGLVYHVNAKGNGGAPLFLDDIDRHAFCSLLATVVARYGWNVLAWCLMSNHLHLVVETPDPNLSAGKQWLLSQFARRRHRRFGTSGHVFHDRFHSRVIDDDVYLCMAVRYVVRNPLEPGLARSVREWRWSSHAALAGGWDDTITAADRLFDLFGAWGRDGRERYMAWVEAGLEETSSDPLPPMAFELPSITDLIAEHGFVEGAHRARDAGHSMRDIARATNVSAMTVSRRLRTA